MKTILPAFRAIIPGKMAAKMTEKKLNINFQIKSKANILDVF